MQLIANKAFPYGGRPLKPGDPFNASKKDAALLVYVKYAKYGTEDEEPVKKSGYKKQNMVAEESSAAKKTGKAQPKKREYKRRDMKADD